MLRRIGLCLLGMAFGPAAVAATLVNDFNSYPQIEEYASAEFNNAATVAQGTLFVAGDAGHGRELWITDGTPAGTRLLKDINPGPDWSNVTPFTVITGVAYFFADDGTNGFELWRTDGTTAGTQLVVNIGPGSTHYTDGDIGVSVSTIGSLFYFPANDGSGEELWRSDGTAGGTYKVSDIVPGAAGAEVFNLMAVGARLYFTARDVNGVELWTSDGTTQGTRMVQNIGPAAADAHIDWMTPVNGFLFFTANDVVHGVELWRANIDGNGAIMMGDLNSLPVPGQSNTQSSDPLGLFALGDAVIFVARITTGLQNGAALCRASTTGTTATSLHSLDTHFQAHNVVVIGSRALLALDQIWLTDGTAAGTAPFASRYFEFPENLSLTNGAVAYSGGDAFFFARDVSGPEGNAERWDLWRSDGTQAGTRMIVDLDSFSPTSEIAVMGGRFYFSYYDSNQSPLLDELWSSDGTAVGTRSVRDVPLELSDFGYHLKVSGGRLFAVGFVGEHAWNPWVSDGTSAGTVQLADLQSRMFTEGSDPEVIGRVGTRLLVSAIDVEHGRELWVTDGTEANTQLLRDLNPGPDHGSVGGALSMNGFALFSASTPGAGSELWRTDGTPNGTVMVKDVFPGPDNGAGIGVSASVVRNGVAYFLGDDGVHGTEIWRSDGTAVGTQLAVELTPGPTGLYNISPTLVNNRMVIMAYRNGGNEVYSSDGTPAGTVLLTSAVQITTVVEAVSFQNRMCFVGTETAQVYDVYCSDGSAGNMQRISNFGPLGIVLLQRMVVVNGQLVVDAFGPGLLGGGIYASDGTITGWHKISDLHIDNADGRLISSGTRYVFGRGDGQGGSDFVVTDGTSAGTHAFLPSNAPPRQTIRASQSPFAGFGDAVLFNVIDPDRGTVLWRSDGTVQGTRLLLDLDPATNEAVSPYQGFFQDGNRLFFSAFRRGIGNELWLLSAVDPNAADDYVRTTAATAVAVNVLGNDADIDGSLSPATVQVVAAPASGATSINTGTGAITYTPNAGFTGVDTFTYRVNDGSGNLSNVANVIVTVTAAVSATAPGTAPPPPTQSPPATPSPPGQQPPPGGGGGGALGLELLLLLLLIARLAHADPRAQGKTRRARR